MRKVIFLALAVYSQLALCEIEADYKNNVAYAKGAMASVQSSASYSINASDYCAAEDIACQNELSSPAMRGASDVTITNDATTAYYSNSEAQDIQNRFNKGSPDLRTDPAYSHAIVVQNNAFEITHGISNTYVDCDTGKTCAENVEEQFCHIPTGKGVLCETTPHITNTTGEAAWLSQTASYLEDSYIGWWEFSKAPIAPSLPTEVKQIVVPDMATNGNVRFYVNGIFAGEVEFHGFQHTGAITLDTNVTVTTNPVYVTTSYGWDNHKVKNPPIVLAPNDAPPEPIQLKMNTQVHEYEWITSCDEMIPECKQVSYDCVEGAEVRYWEGVYTYMDCWKYRAFHECNFPNTCGDLSEAVILNQSCSLMIEGVCVQEAITKEVTTLECKDTNLQCGTETFCLDGGCYTPTPTQSEPQTFNENLSGLAGLAESAENLTNPPLVFKGTHRTCEDKALGMSNCCQDGGWATDLGLLSCSASEKALGQAKEKKVTIYVGRYCAEKVFKWCIRHKKSYCVYDSKLARIIQQDGSQQIGKTFGSAKSPNCSGLTPEQLQSMNFELMDFSDFYSDLNNNISIPDPIEIQNRISSIVEGS